MSEKSLRKSRWFKILLIGNLVAYSILVVTTFLFAGTIAAIFADDETARNLGFAGSAGFALCASLCPLFILNVFALAGIIFAKVFFGKGGLLSDDEPQLFKKR